MNETLWRAFAWLVSRKPIADYLIRRALRTPYRHIVSADGTDRYMGRWWLFNPYDGLNRKRFTWLPSVRIHHICRADNDRVLHDHPWDARTIILRGHYFEQRVGWKIFWRDRGETATLKFNEFHRIASVPHGGVWTMFITYQFRGEWGFLVDGEKVHWRDYTSQVARS